MSDLLFGALSQDDLSTVQARLAAGDSLNGLNAAGSAPLHVIATKSFRNQNTFPIIEALVAAGADINLPNAAGLTPVQVALGSGWQDTAAFLFENLGAKFDAATRQVTHITCPDCKRVADSWEASGYKPTGYKFYFSKYNKA